MQFKRRRVNHEPIRAIVIGIIIFLTTLLFINANNKIYNYKNTIRDQHDSITILHDSITNLLEFSPNNLLILLEYYNIKKPDKVVKQSKLETGHFTSKVFIENNNLFGMGYPRVRTTTSVIDSNGYAKYKNYIESIKDYKLYQLYYYKGGSYDSFLLQSKYSQDSNYIKKINRIK
jgi:uncharacterized FlgJ-related protein